MFNFFDRTLKGSRITILSFAIIYTIIFWLAMLNAIEVQSADKLTEKRIEIAKSLNRIGDHIDRETQKYPHIIGIMQDDLMTDMMNDYDAEPMTYAAVYKQLPNGFDNLSARHPSYEGSPFEPFSYPEFASAITAERGEIVLNFAPADAPARDMYVCWRWTPNPANHENPYLLIIGISEYTVSVQTSTRIMYTAVYGGIGMIAINTILIGYILHIVGRRNRNETN